MRCICVGALMSVLSVSLVGCAGGENSTSVQSVQSEPGRESASTATSMTDDAIIARERATWDALKQKDLARFVSLTGNSPRIRFVTEDGIEFASSEEAGKEILSCTTHDYALDEVSVDRVDNEVVLVSYKVKLNRTCGKDKTSENLYAMSAWAHRGGTWQAVAQSVMDAAQ